ncbi:MAG: hypothetical protein KDD51_13735 [Bdellovibrionales bacterium]|nr:hypothetical protein [Bdellovibrionales bacterium]
MRLAGAGWFRIVLFPCLLWVAPVFSQPWLANHQAQNCAACHSPSRLNLPAAKRRCTLSCQGCHVNPNGGGLRSRYGVWNQQRWQRSFALDALHHKKAPAPAGKQSYLNAAKGKPKSKPVPLVETDELEPTLSEYNKYSDDAWKSTALNYAEFKTHMSDVDPYHEERAMPIQAGGDFRYFIIAQDGQPTHAWFMGADLGVRVRPTPEMLSLVFESRFLNQPTNTSPLAVFTSEARVRSAYVLVDDLPYNTHVMYGLYRPMFGLYHPDHTALGQVLSGLTQRSVFHAIGIGSAPNVPFLNAHLIFPGPTTSADQSSGFVINLGGRWVTAGISLLISYWSTTTPDALAANLQRKMLSVSIGTEIDRLIFNSELLRFEKEFQPGNFDRGTVWSNRVKYRFWREQYLVLNHAFSNTARNGKAGSSNEFMLGAMGYLLPGTQAELLYVRRYNLVGSTPSTESGIQFQTHIYF